jgi:DNA topoisomerase IA
LDFKLVEIKKTKSKKSQPAPFITSTLQQEASSKLGR